MHPLPRILALGLFVLLAALCVLLAAPTVRVAPPAGSAEPVYANTAVTKFSAWAKRASLPIAVTSAVLAMALAAGIGLRQWEDPEPLPHPSAHRLEMGALTKLAASTAEQGEQLAHERDARSRAQADALLHQQRLNRALEEKIQLGRDLHDGIIQSLYAVGLQIEAARAVAANDLADADRRLSECREQLNRTIRDARAYIAGLAPENLRQTSFSGALQSLVAELGRSGHTQFELQINETASAQLSLDQSTEALQVAREAVSNALRHGHPARIALRVEAHDNAICLHVRDNGTGFDPVRRGTGHGLANMRARADRIGGTLSIESSPELGTHVVFTMPAQPLS